ncbi:MAG: thioredoxin domain-containing protein [Alphaproteobacteria bacterium]
MVGGSILLAGIHGFGGQAQAILNPGFEGDKVELSQADRDFLLKSSNIPHAGNPDGSVVLAEFSDFRCPHCRASASSVRRLLRRDEDLLVVFPSFPLLGPDSVELALFGLAAHRQNRYEDWHFTVMTWPGRVRASKVSEIATHLELDFTRLEADADSEELREALRANREFAQKFKIRGIPTFLAFSPDKDISGRLLRGERTDDELSEVFRRLRNAS